LVDKAIDNHEHTGEADHSQQNFVIHRTYLKDLSFESGDTPQIFQQEWQPQMNFDLNSRFQKIAEDTYEVILQATLTTKLQDKDAYIVEAQYAGIFGIRDFPAEQLDALLKSYCPTVLFPYLREIFFDVVNRGSFPQIHIAPINFDALYAEHLKQQMGEDNHAAVNDGGTKEPDHPIEVDKTIH